MKCGGSISTSSVNGQHATGVHNNISTTLQMLLNLDEDGNVTNSTNDWNTVENLKFADCTDLVAGDIYLLEMYVTSSETTTTTMVNVTNTQV